MSTPTVDPSRDIRPYLELLSDTDQTLEEIKEAYNEATDPVERVRLRGRLHRVAARDDAEQRFVASVRQWAEQEGVPASALVEEGVPAEVLQRAGLEPDTGASQLEETGEQKPSKPRKQAASKPRKRSSSKSTQKSAAPQKGKSSRGVSAQTVRAAMPAERAFTISELMEKTGASRNTVRTALEQAMAAGEVIESSLQGEWSNRGRPAKSFHRVK